eukprot:gb/GEZJ01004504.1/.p1 GENE.gb/GEZJ01004504.1/~~gb/GEZJ01004504.1/.p1  ORF type:complete len:120 (+),score=6.07 gb/GEZJ01004504.1/:2719-3078(+)
MKQGQALRPFSSRPSGDSSLGGLRRNEASGVADGDGRVGEADAHNSGSGDGMPIAAMLGNNPRPTKKPRSRSDAKRKQCSMCGKTFYSSTHVEIHEKTVSLHKLGAATSALAALREFLT